MSITLVANNVFRGPRPQPADYPWILQNISTVISFEGQAEDDKEKAALLPIPVLSQPISFAEMYFPWAAIPAIRLEYLVQLIKGCAGPVLCHCQRGQDRTGLVIAAYRVRVCGRSKDEAMAEALKFGYRN